MTLEKRTEQLMTELQTVQKMARGNENYRIAEWTCKALASLEIALVNSLNMAARDIAMLDARLKALEERGKLIVVPGGALS